MPTLIPRWHLFDDYRLSATASRFIDDAASNRQKIALSSISLAEVVYLIEKDRLPEAAYSDLRKALADPHHVLEEAVFSADVVEALRKVSRAEVPCKNIYFFLTDMILSD